MLNLYPFAAARRQFGHCWAELAGLFVKVSTHPILVFGNAKSGTTIIAYLLSEALQKTYTADIVRAIPEAALGFQLEHELLSARQVVDKYRLEFSRGVIKEPALTNHASKFVDFFPEGHFVFLMRDPRDNIRSILDRLKIPGHLNSLNLNEWAELRSTPAWRLALDDSWRRVKTDGNYIDVLARNWNMAYEQFRMLSARVTLVRYEDFRNDKANTIYSICNQLGFEIRTDIASLVDTQKQVKGNATTNLVEFFGPENLSRIERSCADGLHTMGYPPSLMTF